MARILIFDLETSDLNADWGQLLCVGYKWYDERQTHVLAISDYEGWNKTPAALLDDSRLWVDFMKVYNQADLIVTFFGKGFDQKFLIAKVVKHHLEIPENVSHVDLFYTIKSNFKISRKSLDNTTKFLGLQTEDIHKTPVSGDVWQLARVGDENAIAKVVEHCRADILLTEALYDRVKPLIRTHPRVGTYLQCRTCGSNRITHQGTKLTVTKGVRIKVRCAACGSWDSRSQADAPAA